MSSCSPEVERERLKPREQRPPQIAQRMPPARQPVIDHDDPSAGFHDATQLTQGSLAVMARLFVQQKEYDRLVIACVSQLQISGIHRQQAGGRTLRQLGTQVP